jgi:hypothetical protein
MRRLVFHAHPAQARVKAPNPQPSRALVDSIAEKGGVLELDVSNLPGQISTGRVNGDCPLKRWNWLA